jgi:two-component system, chemotaxis family, protein-glutamate methylesterase/glutaminase
LEQIRVLIVDDDVISRMLLRTILEKESDFRVVGLAPTGERCITNIPLQKPDVVTLDIEMPGMGGIETLKQIRATWPDLPVIMYSSSTEQGAAVTLQALELGASDYVTKPQGRSVDAFPIEAMREKLLPMIRGLAGGVTKTCPKTKAPKLRANLPGAARRPNNPIDVVTIGLSTGGPNALARVIPKIQGDLPVPLVMVQHMPKAFTGLLADRLNENSGLTVVEGQDGMELNAGTLYIAPGDFHMTVVKDGDVVRLALDQGPKVQSCRPAADVLFKSVDEVYGANTLAVVMTGMGCDGRDGCVALQKSGARVIIQDEETSVVWGMPGSVAEAGAHHGVFPLDDIANAINTQVHKAGRSGSSKSKSA